MKRIEAIAADIVAREGGYVNDPDDPDDPGGATKFGVTLATLRRLRLDLTGDKRVSVADVKAMTPERARDIYIRDYYFRPQINKLPEPIQASVFDMQVNAGGNAVKILQRLLRDMGHLVSVDGAIGPQTLRAAELAYDEAPNIWRMPMGFPGATTTTGLAIDVGRFENLPVAGMAAKAGGSSGPRNSFQSDIT